MKNYKIKMILKDLTIIELEGKYSVMSEIFSRLTSELILRNKTENDILKLSFKL